jgi:histidinol-phosphate aminotransferase
VRRLWRSVLDALPLYDPGPPLERLAEELGQPDLVRLSANENPLGPSPRAAEAVTREASRIHLYPDGGSTALREALAHHLGIQADQLVIGNGADELIALIAAAAFEPGDEVVVPEPSFEPYAIGATLAGARVVGSPLAGYDIDLDDVRARVTDRTKAVMLCSPHNPATTIIRRSSLLRFLEALGPDSPIIVLDEAYRDFCDDSDYPDGVALLRHYPRLVVLRTFSKIAGLAGLRVGYAAASAETIDRLNRTRAPYNVNRLAQVAALAALEDQAHLDRTRRLVIEERAFLSAELTKRGYRFPRSYANFLLVAVPDAGGLRARLMKAGILVRDGASVGFPGHLRFSVGLRETNQQLLSLL